MVVKLMIILTIATATSRDWRLEGGLSDSVCCPALSWCLRSQKTVSISALMGCCCAGLGMRRPGCLLAAPSDILWMLSAWQPGQSCLLPGRGRGGTFVNKTVTWTGSPGQARLTPV